VSGREKKRKWRKKKKGGFSTQILRWNDDGDGYGDDGEDAGRGEKRKMSNE